MPKGKELKDFGPEFEQLLLKADRSLASGLDEFPVMFATHKLAHSLRFRIYAYFAALRGSPDRPDLAAMCSNLSMRVAGTSLVFYRRGEDMEAAALRDALGLEKGFDQGPTSPSVIAAPTTLSNNLAQLDAIRAKSAKSSKAG